MSTAAPTSIRLPTPDPLTPSEAPGTPNSTTTSMSELSTVAIKDGHRGHLPHAYRSQAPTSGTLDAERADRISRLAGLERVTTARNPPPNANLTPGLAAPHSPVATGYFDNQGNPTLNRERSTVGSASATGSLGGRTTWASESDAYDKMSESQDMDTDTHSIGAASDTNSLVAFGEGARTPAKTTPTTSQPLHKQHQRDSSLTPVHQSDREDSSMTDAMPHDRRYVTPDPRGHAAGSGVETAERIIRERLGPEGGNGTLGSTDAGRDAGRDLGKFYFESNN